VIDGQGGLYVLQSRDPANAGDNDLYVVHALSDGSYAGSAAGERFVHGAGDDVIAAAIPDSSGGFYAAWTRGGNGYVGHHAADATTPVAFALVSSSAVAGVNEVAWQVADRAFAGGAWRRVTGGPWSMLGPARADGAGVVTVRDSDVVPGVAYCYRLADASGAAHPETEACVTAAAMPATPVAIRPVPTRGHIDWTLGAAGAVDVRVFDLAGRTVLRRHVPGGRAGVDLPPGLPAGLYLLALRHGDQQARARIVLVR